MEQATGALPASPEAYEEIHAPAEVDFHRIYTGDAAALRSTFHPGCRLFANVSATPYEKSVDEYVVSKTFVHFEPSRPPEPSGR